MLTILASSPTSIHSDFSSGLSDLDRLNTAFSDLNKAYAHSDLDIHSDFN